MPHSSFNNRYILGISFISALGGYLFGFDFAVITGALPFLRDQFGLDAYWEGFATGSLALGAIAGCLLAGTISDRYGRRKGLLLAAAVFCISSLALSLAPGRFFFIGARFMGALWLPESPRWLVSVGRADRAMPILEKIGGADYSRLSLATITRSMSGNNKMSYRAAFGKAVFPAVLIGIGLAVFQQLCGINVVFNYAPRIFQSIGVPQDGQLLQTVFIGGVNLAFTLLAMLLVDRLGPEPLILAGARGLAVP